MNPNAISCYLLKTFDDLRVIDSWGETSFFYNPNNLSPRGTYFCTIKEKDGQNDKASSLDRQGVFRLNFGISKPTFLELFEVIPKRPSKGGVIEGPYDFTSLNQLTPHPVYGWMCWVSICNPSEKSFSQIAHLISESYQIVKQKHKNKKIPLK
ncbi:MAG: DUF6194 family protein [Candidatus Algichlamydia australiensis]|nr:DUF6194 family protein [Chlamydiales bacterium]